MAMDDAVSFRSAINEWMMDSEVAYTTTFILRTTPAMTITILRRITDIALHIKDTVLTAISIPQES